MFSTVASEAQGYTHFGKKKISETNSDNRVRTEQSTEESETQSISTSGARCGNKNRKLST